MEMYLEKVSNFYKDFINEVSLYINETMRINKKEVLHNNDDRKSMEILCKHLNMNGTITYKNHVLLYTVENSSGNLLVKVLPLDNSPVMLKSIGFIFDHPLYNNDKNELVSELVASVDTISLKKNILINNITA